jgi:hypothetical protein
MAKGDKDPYEVGFGKPPQSTQFKPGESGNPDGRPRGAKNFATAIEQELVTRITVTENGRRRRISKREVIAKHLVNKAASGDLKAIPLLLNEARAHQSNPAEADPDQVFDTPRGPESPRWHPRPDHPELIAGKRPAAANSGGQRARGNTTL